MDTLYEYKGYSIAAKQHLFYYKGGGDKKVTVEVRTNLGNVVVFENELEERINFKTQDDVTQFLKDRNFPLEEGETGRDILYKR